MPPLACTPPQHIEYAKTKSYATLKRDDPNFIPPTSIHAQNTATRLGGDVFANGQKRDREEDAMDQDRRQAKREKTDESDEEEMEIEDEDELVDDFLHPSWTALHHSSRIIRLPVLNYPSFYLFVYIFDRQSISNFL